MDNTTQLWLCITDQPLAIAIGFRPTTGTTDPISRDSAIERMQNGEELLVWWNEGDEQNWMEEWGE